MFHRRIYSGLIEILFASSGVQPDSRLGFCRAIYPKFKSSWVNSKPDGVWGRSFSSFFRLSAVVGNNLVSQQKPLISEELCPPAGWLGADDFTSQQLSIKCLIAEKFDSIAADTVRSQLVPADAKLRKDFGS